MKRPFIVVCLLSITAMATGCATFDGAKLENRLVCTVAKDNAYMVSEYGPVGISSKIAAKDAAVVCK